MSKRICIKCEADDVDHYAHEWGEPFDVAPCSWFEDIDWNYTPQADEGEEEE